MALAPWRPRLGTWRLLRQSSQAARAREWRAGPGRGCHVPGLPHAPRHGGQWGGGRVLAGALGLQLVSCSRASSSIEREAVNSLSALVGWFRLRVLPWESYRDAPGRWRGGVTQAQRSAVQRVNECTFSHRLTVKSRDLALHVRAPKILFAQQASFSGQSPPTEHAPTSATWHTRSRRSPRLRSRRRGCG